MVNFLPDPRAALSEMCRVTRPGGTIAASVWDYAGEMTLLRAFWDAAEVDPARAEPLDEGKRMSHCNPADLEQLWLGADLVDVATDALVVHARSARAWVVRGKVSGSHDPG